MIFIALDVVPVKPRTDKGSNLLGINCSINMSYTDQKDSKREQEEKRRERDDSSLIFSSGDVS